MELSFKKKCWHYECGPLITNLYRCFLDSSPKRHLLKTLNCEIVYARLGLMTGA